MIEHIINKLLEDKNIVKRYNLKRSKISYGLISTGGYRKYEASRINFVIFSGKTPILFVKFYKDRKSNALLEREFETQKIVQKKYKNLRIPVPIELLEIDGFKVLVEEAYSGKTLYKCLKDNPATETLHEVIEHANEVQGYLNENLTPSNFTEFKKEIDNLSSEFISLYMPTPLEEFLITKFIKLLTEEFKNKNIYKRYTNWDFVSKNILLTEDEGRPILLDFEFTEETHLYFLDWFRFFVHYFDVPKEMVDPILNDYSGPPLADAFFYLKEFEDLSLNPLTGAKWLLFYMKDFIIKSLVFPRLELERERTHLKSTLLTLFTSTFPSDEEIITYMHNSKIVELETTVQEKLDQIDSINAAIQSKDEQARNLEASMQEKDSQISELDAAIQSKDSQIRALEATVQEKLDQVESMNVTLQEKDTQISDLGSAIQSKDSQIRALEATVQSIHQSVTWQLVMKYHRIMERLLPPGTRRRRYYDLWFLGIRTIANEGWRSFWWKVKQYTRERNPFPKRKIKIEEIDLPKDEHKEVNETIKSKVSIVIPTKNAGNEFDYVLNKIKHQKGVKELELVVVDSGSTDETLNIARKYGAKLYQIKPEEFDHGKTRNLGAEKATGGFILFTTQDAIFSSEYLVSNMVKVLRGGHKIAAVTCRQIPRSDADLMACFQVWNHCYKFLEINVDKVVFVKDIDDIAPLQKRKLANLSDSCCCIRRNLFLDYRFKVNFAEDLDLGIRLLKDGYKLAYLHNNAIIHSHNRPAPYFFKVSYTDSRVVSQIIGNKPMSWNVTDINIFYAGIKKLYNNLKWSIHHIENVSQNDIGEVFQILETSLYSNGLKRTTGSEDVIDLDKLFDEIESIINYNSEITPEKNMYNFLLNPYLGTLKTFHEYLSVYPSISPIKNDFINTLYKLFANSSGAALGNFVLFLHEKNVFNKKVEHLEKFLVGEV